MKTMGMTIASEPRRVAYGEVELREPGPGDAVVAARYVGVCGSDLELLDDLPQDVPNALK